MRHASLGDLKAICRHFQAHRDVFPHIRQDALRRRIEAHQCIYQDGVIVVYQQYKKRTRVGDVQVPAGAVMLHQILNSDQFNRAGGGFFGGSRHISGRGLSAFRSLQQASPKAGSIRRWCQGSRNDLRHSRRDHILHY
jgi:hypothetical protein